MIEDLYNTTNTTDNKKESDNFDGLSTMIADSLKKFAANLGVSGEILINNNGFLNDGLQLGHRSSPNVCFVTIFIFYYVFVNS